MQKSSFFTQNSTACSTGTFWYSTKRLMNRLSHKIILRTDQIRSDGTCLISVQAFVNGQKVVLGLNQYCRPDQWNRDNRRVATSSDNAALINMAIEKAISKCIDIKARYFLREKPLTRDAFINEFTRPEMRMNFISWARHKIETEFIHSRAEGTVRHYRNTLKLIETIRGDIHFGNINYQFIKDFENWMCKHNYHTNNKWKQHKNLRMFINEAIRCDIHIENPYEKFAVKSIDGKRSFLTNDECKKLEVLYDSKTLNPAMQEELRRFLFTCYTGLRYSDSLLVRHDQIEDDILIFVPKKTAATGLIVRMPLSNKAKKYISGNGGLLFNVMTQKTSQLHLKDIARLAGISKHITAHTGRHTFATLFLIAGGKVHVLQSLLGHRKIESTMTYVHIVQASRREQIMLMDKL